MQFYMDSFAFGISVIPVLKVRTTKGTAGEAVPFFCPNKEESVILILNNEKEDT